MAGLEEYEMLYTFWLRLRYFGRVLVEGILDKFNADGAPSGIGGGALLGFEYFIILKCVRYCFPLPSLPHMKKI